MKTRLLGALVGLAISFALPTFAQTVDPQTRQQIEAAEKNYDVAFNKNDAAAVAALFTTDAVETGPDGPRTGQQAIKDGYAKLFQKWKPTDHLNTILQMIPVGNEVAVIMKWSVEKYSGYVNTTMQHQGDQWLVHVATYNITQPPAATSAATPSNTPDPQLRQKLVDVIAKHADATNKNDAAAAAACFTQNGVYVTDRGPINGREAIEKWYADLFQKVQFSNHVITVDPDSPHVIGTAGDQMWATGGWSTDIKGKDFGPTQIKGYWSVIREGDDWKIRMLTSNVTPAPAATTTPSPTSSKQ